MFLARRFFMVENNSYVMKDNQYRYQGVKLTPSIFTAILIQLYDGRRFERQDAINKVVHFHTDNGGNVKDTNPVSVFKKSSANLKKKGYLTNVSYGVWELKYRKQKVENKDNNNNDESDQTALKQNNDIKNIRPQKVIGRGKERVYVYYYSTYRKLAEKKQLKKWPCKIGKTNTTAVERVLSQSGTAYPEYPTLSLVIKCDNSSTLENAIHAVLQYRKRQIKDSPSTEWYFTNDDEVESIYSFLNIDDDY